MSDKKETPVLLLTGYLGSGKTTLLNRILTNRRGIRFAVIVNDIGEVNIDADLIQRGGVVGQDSASDDLIALQNGCICCSLSMDLVRQLSDLIATRRFDYIVIEASGICEPEPIAQTICSMAAMDASVTGAGIPRLDCIVSVVDALRLRDEFGCGDRLSGDRTGDDIENLIIEQIEFCNIILLNKISEVSAADAGRIRAIVRAIQPTARIIECDYADVPLDDILDTGLFDFDSVAASAAWIKEIEKPADDGRHHHDHHDGHHHDHDDGHHHHHHDHDGDECDDPSCGCHHHHHHDHDGHHSHHSHIDEFGIQTFVYYRRRPFDLHKFDRFVAQSWPMSIIRAKGLVWFRHNGDMSFIFEQAGRQKKLTEAGFWYATAPEDELKVMFGREPGLARDWDPLVGDRMVKLVIIGRGLDIPAITASLDACLAY